jgi:mono/diheme cytochrome c family protein
MAALRAILLLTCILALTPPAPTQGAPEPVVIAAPTAAELVDALGCRGCHHLDRRGGERGPALDGVGKRYDAARLRLWLLWPQSLKPGTVMPAYDFLEPEQIALLVDFLQRQK